jgi:hypothetical protein
MEMLVGVMEAAEARAYGREPSELNLRIEKKFKEYNSEAREYEKKLPSADRQKLKVEAEKKLYELMSKISSK